MKDKIVKQDNLLKVQRKTIDDIAVDLSSQVKCLSDELKQQSVLIKKLQEENQSLHKKNAKLSETNVDLLGKQGQLEKEVAFLKEQVEALWRKPLVELTDTPKPQIKPDQECRQNITEEFIESQESKFTDEDLLLVNLPTQNRFAILQDSDTQKKEVEIDSLPNAKDNPSSIKTNGNSTDKLPPPITNANHAVFLCDSNGKFLNTKKMFPPNQEVKYFWCPKIENARATLQNDINDPPQLLLIHTGTNDLSLTTSTDEFISDLSTLITEAATKFPTSKIIYSTLLPRADVPIPTILRINEQLIAECSRLPNVHLINHANLFAEGLDVLHDAKHIKRRHIGLFAANLIDAIRGRARQTRYSSKSPNHFLRSPRRQRSAHKERYLSYSDALRNKPAGGHQLPYSQPQQQLQQTALSGFQQYQAHRPDNPQLQQFQQPPLSEYQHQQSTTSRRADQSSRENDPTRNKSF